MDDVLHGYDRLVMTLDDAAVKYFHNLNGLLGIIISQFFANPDACNNAPKKVMIKLYWTESCTLSSSDKIGNKASSFGKELKDTTDENPEDFFWDNDYKKSK